MADDQKFDGEGYLTDEEEERLNCLDILEGESAALELASIFAGMTKGNYTPDVLHSRAGLLKKFKAIRLERT